MNSEPNTPAPLSELPLVRWLFGSICSVGMDLLDARHERSYMAGAADSTSKQAPPSQGDAPVHIVFSDQRPAAAASPGLDESVFNSWKLAIDSALKSDFKNDCTTRLENAPTPTPSQLRAILANDPGLAVEGGASCGKSVVVCYRVLVLHHYLKIPAEHITVIAADADSKLKTTEMLTRTLELWWVPDAAKIAGEIVKTLPEAVLEVARSVPGMAALRLFECGGGDEHTFNPYSQRLPASCYAQIDTYCSALYRSNKAFAQAVVDLYRRTLLLQPLESDHPEVIKRSRAGWALEPVDEELSNQVVGLWKRAGVWPVKGIAPVVSEIDLCGRAYRCHGFVEQLNAYVCLGFDRSEDRFLRRSPQAHLETYKEVEIKKTLLRAYSDKPIIHLDSYQQARELAATLSTLANVMPSGMRVRAFGHPEAKPLVMAIWDAVACIETLGLGVKESISRTSFMPGDIEADLYKVVGMLWFSIEKSMLEAEHVTMTYGRMLSMFSGANGGNLRFVPFDKLSRLKHLLIDDAEVLSPAGANWVRAVLKEQKRRALQLGLGRSAVNTSLMMVGDPLGGSYCSKGASAQPLTGFNAFFGASGGVVQLLNNFVSPQPLIDISEAIISQMNDGVRRQIVGPERRPAGTIGHMISFRDFERSAIRDDISKALSEGQRVLVIPDQAETYSLMASVLLPLIDAQKQAGSGKLLFVRQACKVRDVPEVDVLVLVGSFFHVEPSSFRDQLFKLAGQGDHADICPHETAMQMDGLTGAATSIARTRKHVLWYSPANGRDCPPGSPIVLARRASGVDICTGNAQVRAG